MQFLLIIDTQDFIDIRLDGIKMMLLDIDATEKYRKISQTILASF